MIHLSKHALGFLRVKFLPVTRNHVVVARAKLWPRRWRVSAQFLSVSV
jgi:hypothetical protein